MSTPGRATAPDTAPESLRRLLLAVLLAGLGWLALLPPWEGFDEAAHYSYIQQIADVLIARTTEFADGTVQQIFFGSFMFTSIDS